MATWAETDQYGNPITGELGNQPNQKQPAGGPIATPQPQQPQPQPVDPLLTRGAQPWQPDTSPEHARAVHEAYDALPWTAKLSTMASDIARNAAHGYTGGLNNLGVQTLAKAAGGTLGDPTEIYRQREQEDADARIRAPMTANVADMAGMYFSPIGRAMPVEKTVQEVAPAAPGVSNFIDRTALRLGLGGGEGMTFNALNQLGHGQDPKEGAGGAALFGAGATAGLTPILTRMAGTMGRPLGATVDPMPETGSESNPVGLYGSKSAAYDTVGQYPRYNWYDSAVAVLRARQAMEGGNLRMNTAPAGGTQTLHPASTAHLTGLEENLGLGTGPGTGFNQGKVAPDPIDVMQAKEALYRDAATPGDQAVARPLHRELDNLMQNNPTISGDNAWDAVNEARRANARYKNAMWSDAATEAAANNPGSTQTVPARARAVLDDPHQRGFLTPDEQTAMQGVARGSNWTPWLDKLNSAPGMVLGAGAGALANAGIGGGHLPTWAALAAVPVVAQAGKAGMRAMTAAALDNFKRVGTDTGPVRNYFAEAVNGATYRDALTRSLLGYENK